MIIDSHLHAFPYLGGASGYESIDMHLWDSQRLLQVVSAEPTVRTRDGAHLSERRLWKPDGPAGEVQSNFRVGQFGRFTWEQDGDECFVQFMPPSMQGMSSPPELLLTMMDRAGVDHGVLQCGSIYGRLNGYYKEILRSGGETARRLHPLAQVAESDLRDPRVARTQLDVVAECIESGLAGLWFDCPDLGRLGPEFDTFWRGVAELQVPTFFNVYPHWYDGALAVGEWHHRHPAIPVILPQSFPLGGRSDGRPRVTEDVVRALTLPNTWVEIAYPIERGSIEDYPFVQSQNAVREIFDALGPDRLVWGSDAPNVERYCTYNQSLRFVTEHCRFMSADDLRKVTGENLAGIFGIASEQIQPA